MKAPLAWQRRRTAFNHDWLKNQFVPALGSYQNLLDRQLEGPEFEKDLISQILAEWKEHRQEALSLLADFEEGMSPRRLFDQPPLSRCDEDTRLWLADVIHYLWLARDPVSEWVAQATACVSNADAHFEAFSAQLRACPEFRAALAQPPYHKSFAEFRRACLDLARAIEQFPTEVRVA